MGIDRSGLGGAVTEISLDQPQVDARFKQVRGIRMAQGVHAGVFLHATFLQRGFEGALDTTLIHRLRSSQHAGLCPPRMDENTIYFHARRSLDR